MIFPFNLDTNLTILAKWLLLQGLAGAAVLAGGVALLGPMWERYRTAAALPVIALAGWLAWGTLSVFVNPASAHFLGYWLPSLTAGLAVLLAPVLLTSERRCLALLIGIVAASIIVGVIGIVSSLGYGGILKFLYGIDLSALQDGRWRVQGGARSAAAMSTLANPEYAGTYSAAMVCLWAVILLDGGASLMRAGRTRLAWIVRAVAIGVIPLLLLHIVYTGSRQALVTVGLLGVLRLVIALGVRLRVAAAIFCLYILGMVLLGLLPGVVLFALLIIALLAWELRCGRLKTVLIASDRFNLLVVVGIPLLVLMLAGLYSVPGPWNPTGLRLWSRFSSLLSSQDDSYQERLVMFTLASRLATKNPILGIGPGRYRAEFFREFGSAAQSDSTGTMSVMRDRMGMMLGEQSHNDYLQISAETGLVGISLFLIALLLIMEGLVRVIRTETGMRRFLALAYLIGIGAMLSLMQTSFPLQMPSRAAVFWMLLAGGVGIISQSRRVE
ncbi:hypothetical protein GC173_18935 [bacterium]|nr:hypothetical protein [bacterium]